MTYCLPTALRASRCVFDHVWAWVCCVCCFFSVKSEAVGATEAGPSEIEKARAKLRSGAGKSAPSSHGAASVTTPAPAYVAPVATRPAPSPATNPAPTSPSQIPPVASVAERMAAFKVAASPSPSPPGAAKSKSKHGTVGAGDKSPMQSVMEAQRSVSMTTVVLHQRCRGV